MKRPFPVTAVGWLFIVAGAASSIYHLQEGPLDRWTFLILLVGIAAIVGGAYLLKGASWARWLLLVWMALHVVISAFNSLSDSLPHFALLLVLGYGLFRPPISEYFKPTRADGNL